MYDQGARTYRTLAQLRQAGFELHGAQADPLFLNATYGLGANSSLNDLHVQTNSPVVNAGVNLSGLFVADKDGNVRVLTGAWDIGAYAVSASAVLFKTPAPPSSLRTITP